MTRTMTWTAANGEETVLDGSTGITLLHGSLGLEAPNPANIIDEYTGFDGGALVHRRNPVRLIGLGLYLNHPTRIETRVAELAALIRGPGQLTWADDTFTRTLRQVIYETGIDGSGITTPTERVLSVSLVALDPWWYGPTESRDLVVGVEHTAFSAAIGFSSLLPFNGGGTESVPITGDADAYPVFTITGPATTLVVGSGGASWEIAAALPAGETLVVDHRPTSRGPRLNGGPADWANITEASRLFTMSAGLTTIISGSTGTTGATVVNVSWEPRYLTP